MESGCVRRLRVLGAALVALGCSKAGAEPAASRAGVTETPAGAKPPLLERAEGLAQQLIIVDGHVDLPFRLKFARADGGAAEDVSQRTAGGDFDFPRASEGGL